MLIGHDEQIGRHVPGRALADDIERHRALTAEAQGRESRSDQLGEVACGAERAEGLHTDTSVHYISTETGERAGVANPAVARGADRLWAASAVIARKDCIVLGRRYQAALPETDAPADRGRAIDAKDELRLLMIRSS